MVSEYTLLELETSRRAGQKWLFGPFQPQDSDRYTQAVEIGYVSLQEVDSRDRLHFHAKVEEYYLVLSGHLTIKVNEKVLRVPEGHILLVRPPNVHLILEIQSGTKILLIKAPAVLGDKTVVSE